MLKYVARASVAIPFVIALGFALAAIAVMLVQRFGHVAGDWIMAGGLAIIGVIAAIVVSVKEHEEERAEQKAQGAEKRELIGDATAEVINQAPLALLGALMSAPGGPGTLLKVARTLGRNYPLVLLLIMVGALLLPDQQAPVRTATDTPGDDTDTPRDNVAVKPNGYQPADTYH
jgi:hypothetical protein